MIVDPPDQSRSLLVLGAGPAQLGLLEAARIHGIWTAVCDRDPGAPGFALAGRRCIIGTDDEPALERLASALPIGGVISPGTDPPVAVAARIAEKLGLPHPISPATAVLATNKLRQREALAEPAFPAQMADRDTGRGFRSAAPRGRQGRRPHRAGRPFAGAQAPAGWSLRSRRARAPPGAALVEEYLDGPEVTVSGFSRRGEFDPSR